MGHDVAFGFSGLGGGGGEACSEGVAGEEFSTKPVLNPRHRGVTRTIFRIKLLNWYKEKYSEIRAPIVVE